MPSIKSGPTAEARNSMTPGFCPECFPCSIVEPTGEQILLVISAGATLIRLCLFRLEVDGSTGSLYY